MIKNEAMALLFDQIKGNMKDNDMMDKCMVKEDLLGKMEWVEKITGKFEKGYAGWTKMKIIFRFLNNC